MIEKVSNGVAKEGKGGRGGEKEEGEAVSPN